MKNLKRYFLIVKKHLEEKMEEEHDLDTLVEYQDLLKYVKKILNDLEDYEPSN